MNSNYVKFEVYVPLTHVQQVKEAISSAGAGRLGEYDSCIWQTIGTGQFRPLDGSKPFIGEKNKIEQVEEAKLECIVESKLIKNVISAMRSAHPYEVPAFQYWPVFIE